MGKRFLIRRHIENSTGIGLVETIIVIGILGIIMTGVVSLGTVMMRMQSHSNFTFQADNARRSIMSALNGARSWQQTVTDPQNNRVNGPALNCIRTIAPGPVQAGGPCTINGNPYTAVGQQITNRAIRRVRDASGSVVYDASQPNFGLTPQGTFCDTFRTPPLAGNDACPLRFNITWSARCTCEVPDCTAFTAGDTCDNAQPRITVTAVYNPGVTNRTAFNPANYSVPEFIQGTGSAAGGGGGDCWTFAGGVLTQSAACLGNVGLGTDTPARKLSVFDTTAGAQGIHARNLSPANVASSVMSVGNNIDRRISMSVYSSNFAGNTFGQPAIDAAELSAGTTLFMGTTANLPIHLGVNSVTRMTITPAGVGIGSTAPGRDLVITRDTGSPVIRIETAGANAADLQLARGANEYALSHFSDGHFRLYRNYNGVGPSNPIVATSNNMVGVGFPFNSRPFQIFAVYGDPGAGTIQSVNASTGIAANDGLHIYEGTNQHAYIINREPTAIGGPGGDVFIYTGGNVATAAMRLTATGCIYANTGVIGGAPCPSDARLKKDIRPFSLGLQKLLGIEPVYYKFNGLGGHPEEPGDRLGVIAQDVEKVAPELVEIQLTRLRKDDRSDTEIKTVNYSAFTYMLINSVKELYNNWKTDSARLSRLENENDQLKMHICKREPEAEFCSGAPARD